jgi:hypothetical protein
MSHRDLRAHETRVANGAKLAMLSLSHVVDRFVQVLRDVEAIEADRRMRDQFGGRPDVGPPHVHGDRTHGGNL